MIIRLCLAFGEAAPAQLVLKKIEVLSLQQITPCDLEVLVKSHGMRSYWITLVSSNNKVS